MTKEDFTEQSKELTKRLVERGYNENEIQQQISKTSKTDRAHILNQKRQARSNRIPLILTYNHTLPDIKKAVDKHWDLLKINKDFEQVFTELPIIAFRRNRNLRDIFGKKISINDRKKSYQNINHNVLCNKHYIGQSKTTFTLRLNKHQEDVNKRNSLQADQYF